MGLFLTLAYLFFLGSVAGWGMEVLFRHFFATDNPEHKWINPGFCTGPYLPLYGCGTCVLYLLANLGETLGLNGTIEKQLLLFLVMAVAMTGIEYIAGLISVKWMKVRLWDYSHNWGNIQGLICPLFSLIWAVLGAVYYFLIHPHILDALVWLSENLAFSFVIGFFFGVFTVDIGYSAHIVSILKKFAETNGVIVKYEELKEHIRVIREKATARRHFLFIFKPGRELLEHLKSAAEALESRSRR